MFKVLKKEVEIEKISLETGKLQDKLMVQSLLNVVKQLY